MILHTHKQKQHQNNKTKANSYEQLKDADIHSDDDDIVDKKNSYRYKTTLLLFRIVEKE